MVVILKRHGQFVAIEDRQPVFPPLSVILAVKRMGRRIQWHMVDRQTIGHIIILRHLFLKPASLFAG